MLTAKVHMPTLLVAAGLASSKSEASRLLKAGAVQISSGASTPRKITSIYVDFTLHE